MNISAAGGAIRIEVDQITEKIEKQILSRGTRALNALRNTQLKVLTNPSPSPPGSPPGVRSGNLRANWSGMVVAGGSGLTLVMTSNAHYAGFLDNGTRKMAARPFSDRIAQEALPDIEAIYSEPYM